MSLFDLMEPQQEIPLNYLVDNPIVVIYNAEPTWQSGFLQVGFHVANVILGTTWLIIRFILMFFIMIWNFLTQWFPDAQLPSAEEWPAALRRGTLRVWNFLFINNSRITIPLLATVVILYVLVSLNMAACRQALARSQARRAIKRTTNEFDSPKHPPGISMPATWYYRTTSVFNKTLNMIAVTNRSIIRISRQIVKFMTKRLQDLAIIFLGVVLGYRFLNWLGDPTAILVEPNLIEWGGFMSAIRLNLYRAKSIDFFAYALYTVYTVKEYGFKPMGIALGSFMTLIVAILAKTKALLDRQSYVWQHTAMVEPRSGIPDDTGVLTYFAGLMLAFPFIIVLSWLAYQAHQKWLLLGRGPIKKALLAVIMFIPNLVVASTGGFLSYLGAFHDLSEPEILLRRNSEIFAPVESPIEMSQVETGTRPTVTPIKSPFEVSQAQRHTRPHPIINSYNAGQEFKTRIKTSLAISSPLETSRVKTPAKTKPESPSQARPTITTRDLEFFERIYHFVEDIAISVADKVTFSVSHLIAAVLQHWMVIGSIFTMLIIYYFPSIKRILFGNVFSLAFGWTPRFATSIASFSSRAYEKLLSSLETALPTVAESSTAQGPLRPSIPGSPSKYLASQAVFSARNFSTSPLHSASRNVSIVWSLTSWISRPFRTVYKACSDALLVSILFLEGLLGKTLMSSLLVTTIAILAWGEDTMNSNFGKTHFMKALIFFPFQILISVMRAFIRRSGPFGEGLEDKEVYILAFTFIMLLRILNAAVYASKKTILTRQCSTEYEPSDVTVIIPTKGSFIPDDIPAYGSFEGLRKSSLFLYSLGTILHNEPAAVILATTGLEAHKKLNLIAARFGTRRVKVTSIMESEPNLRRQFLKATDTVRTDIICYAHPEVRWDLCFLKNALAPFNDPDVGLVGVPVGIHRLRNQDSQYLTFNPREYRARCLQTPKYGELPHPYAKALSYFPFKIMDLIDHTFTDHGACYSLLNYLECLYYSRYNRESISNNRIDGGIELVSAKTALIRTSILQSTEFRFNFPHQKILGFIPLFAGMRSDAAHFITRKVRQMGYKAVFQDTPSTVVRCTFKSNGVMAYCQSVADRYSSTYRNNLASLSSTIYLKHPWTAYIMLFSLLNIPFVIDSLLGWLLWSAGLQQFLWLYVMALLVVRGTEQYAQVKSYPRGWKWLPFGIGFYYLESVFQIMGLLNAGRPLAEGKEPWINVGFKGF